jgi:DnaJ-class molecular chaperone
MADQEDMRPGDEGQPGDAPVGEDLCPDCSGSGKVDDGTCSTCRGTGRIEEGVGGA